jgi:hypothetical protein
MTELLIAPQPGCYRYPSRFGYAHNCRELCVSELQTIPKCTRHRKGMFISTVKTRYIMANVSLQLIAAGFIVLGKANLTVSAST